MPAYRDGTGTCATCHGVCDARAERCRECARNAPVLVCPRCREAKPRADYLTPAGNRQTYCHPCTTAWHRERRLIVKYGVTMAWYSDTLAAQGGSCAICHEPPDPATHHGVLVVDHDHATGEARALLCHPCNTGLGMFREDPARLRAAALYAEHHAALAVPQR